MKTPKAIIELMLSEDAFSNDLGMQVENIEEGTATLSMFVKENHVNGFNIAHGGISYSLADSALAFAANSYGIKCVSIETSISHTKPSFKGDKLIALCCELNRGRTIGIYSVTVKNQNNKTIALFKGTVHISKEVW